MIGWWWPLAAGGPDQASSTRGTVREAMRTLHNSGLLEGSERSSLHFRRLTGRQIEVTDDPGPGRPGDPISQLLPGRSGDSTNGWFGRTGQPEEAERHENHSHS